MTSVCLRKSNRPSEIWQEYLRQDQEQQIHGSKEKALEEDNAWNAKLPAAGQDIEIQQDAEISMTLNPATNKDILGQVSFPGGEEIEQDTEMSSALDSASGKEMLGQDALALEPQARSQDVERGKCEEKQVMTLLEGAEAEPATGEQNCKALESDADALS